MIAHPKTLFVVEIAAHGLGRQGSLLELAWRRKRADYRPLEERGVEGRGSVGMLLLLGR